MSIDTLLERLDQVKQTGPDRWMASCPTRPDKQPSLSIRELPDGRILVHDFGGDSVEDILDAVGLDMTDLFPDRPLYDGRKAERKPFSAEDALRCIDFEVLIVYLAALETRKGNPLSESDFHRFELAVQRIEAAKGVVWTN